MIIELLRPWALALLPVPVLAWRFLPAAAANAALPVPGPVRRLFSDLSAETRRRPLRLSDTGLKTLGWVLLVLALTGPYSRESELLNPTGRDLMVAVDLSSSMEQQDMVLDGVQVPRFVAVRELLKEFIRSRKGDRVGLIAYGHEAYLISPLSYDVAAIAALLDELAIGLPGHRTDLGRAIGLAIKTFPAEPADNRVLVLLSDGEDNSGELTGLDAATLAAGRGIRIYSIGFAAAIEADGAEILRNIAGQTGGQFFWAKTTADLGATSRAITGLEPVEGPEEETHIVRDWSLYAVALALLVLGGLIVRDIRKG